MFDMPQKGRPARNRPAPPPPWTPEAVEAEMIEAARWLRLTAGRAGARGFALMRLHDGAMTPEQVIALTGAPPESAEDPDDQREIERERERLHFRLMPAKRVGELEAALLWPARHLVAAGQSAPARCVNLWIVSKSGGANFARAIRAAGVPRHLAYRLKDRGLARIAGALTVEGVPLRHAGG
jgi:hypothetical protein